MANRKKWNEKKNEQNGSTSGSSSVCEHHKMKHTKERVQP